MRLSIRGQKLAINAASAGCLAMTAAVVAWAIDSVEPTDAQQTARSAKEATAAAADASISGPQKEDIASLCDIQLRRPLYDPPPPTPEVRQLPPLNVQLLGTILEGDNSMAMIRSEQGKVEYRRVGETLGPTDSPAKVIEILSDGVVLDRASERLTLKVNSERR